MDIGVGDARITGISLLLRRGIEREKGTGESACALPVSLSVVCSLSVSASVSVSVSSASRCASMRVCASPRASECVCDFRDGGLSNDTEPELSLSRARTTGDLQLAEWIECADNGSVVVAVVVGAVVEIDCVRVCGCGCVCECAAVCARGVCSSRLNG